MHSYTRHHVISFVDVVAVFAHAVLITAADEEAQHGRSPEERPTPRDLVDRMSEPTGARRTGRLGLPDC